MMTNEYNTVIYTGVTSDLVKRVWQHQNNMYSKSFTAKYNCIKLVWYEMYTHIEDAIVREKQIKGGNRANKIALINSMNPEWRDFSSDLT